MSADRFITIENVTKRFGDFLAVDDVSLTIGRGEFFSLLGPSGCGKTTLLRMLAGFETPSEGEIRLDGEDMTDTPPNRRPTNMVFQSYAIFPHLTVRDNVAFGLRRLRLPAGEVNARVEHALSLVQLQGYGPRKPDQLSGGQRQRVALARALIMKPKVLLLDEPLSALDKRLREAMQLELRELQRTVGITFVFVTHDQEEALSMSDRIAVMSEGVILQVAPPSDLYEKPSCREVADFIGAMNFFPATLKAAAGDRLTFEAAGIGTLEAARPAAGWGASVKPGDALTLAVRPEKLTLSAEPPAAGPHIRGRVAALAYFGDRTQYQIAADGLEKPMLIDAQNAMGRAEFARDDAVHVAWAPGALLVLKD